MPEIYVEKIIIYNLAPFENNLNLTFNKNDISVLSAINGKGKTTLMSYIVDAFYEMAKVGFSNEFEGKANQLYRVSSPLYILDKNKIAFVYIRFKYENKNLDYVYCSEASQNAASSAKQDYETNTISDALIKWDIIKDFFEKQGFYKGVMYAQEGGVTNTTSENIFTQNIMAYFPSYRNELPAWLNEVYSKQVQEFSREATYSGYLPHKIEIVSNIHSLTNWMLDCTLDSCLGLGVPALTGLNTILSFILKGKGYTNNTKLTIGNRFGTATRLAVADLTKNLRYPNLYNMSSGELALLDIFAELVKRGDGKPVTQGIVLIDEIDKNLHITMQKEVLPVLLTMFPNVQFIVSSHAPFFGLGLAKNNETKLRAKIIDLDINGAETPIENTGLYEECYNLMLTENTKYKEAYEKLKNSTKNVVICEGPTDVKHLKNAITKLNNQDFNEVDFIDAGGDQQLINLLLAYCKLNNSRKIIGLFDRDNASIVNQIEKENQLYYNYGNNVYALCIPFLDETKTCISIEHYYDNFAIKEKDGKRLFFGSEFDDTGISIDKQYRVTLEKKHLKNKIEKDGVIDDTVYKLAENINIALSKSAFADFVESFDNGIGENKFDFTVFNKIFDKIKQILNCV